MVLRRDGVVYLHSLIEAYPVSPFVEITFAVEVIYICSISGEPVYGCPVEIDLSRSAHRRIFRLLG